MLNVIAHISVVCSILLGVVIQSALYTALSRCLMVYTVQKQ